MVTRPGQIVLLFLFAMCSASPTMAGESIIIATRDGDRGNLIKLDGQTFEALAAYRSDYWPAIASLLPLPDGNCAVIPCQDDKPQKGNRATVYLVDTDDFSVFGDSDVAGAYTHTSTDYSTQGGATGGMVNRFGEIFMFAPSGRFGNFDGAMTINGLDPQLSPVDEALAGHYEVFSPDAGSALSNGDWILVMTHPLPPKDKRHVPGRVEIRKRHGLKTRLSPRSTVDGFPKLTTSATSQHDRIAVGDVSGNVYELICNADRHITVGATRRANQLAGTGSMVSDIVATPDGEWVAAINLRGGDSSDGISGGGVWVLEQATLKPKHHVVGLDAVGALAVRHDGSIIVGTNSGALLVFDRTLSKRISQVDGFDSVTHIVLPVASDGSVTRVAKRVRTDASGNVARHPNWVNALHPQGKAGPPITLAREGWTDYYIVCAADPTTQDVKAAMDLANWLKHITGATFQLIQEASDDEHGYVVLGVGRGLKARVQPDKFISIGQTQLSTQVRKTRDLEDGGYEIHARGDNMILRGGRTRGIINAVYALLEEDLGCRWYTAKATSIPYRPTLRFSPVSRVYVPALRDRRDVHYSEANNTDWSLRNRTITIGVNVPNEWGGYAKPLAGFTHTFNGLVPKSEFDAHPEYFMIKDGRRNSHQLCLTNAKVRQIVIDTTLARLKQSPNSRIVDISPNDGGGTCACETCKAISDAEGSNMGPLLDFVNVVADAVKKDYPHIQVTTLAYLDTKFPPKTIRPRDNVLLWLATDDHNWQYLLLYAWETEKFSEALQAWHAIGARFVIWDYPIDYHNYIVPLPNMPLVAPNMRYYARHGATGVFLQGQHYPTYGVDRSLMRCWVWSKQMWDLSREAKPVIRDFNYGFYGKAAEPMQQYDDMLWNIWERLHAAPERVKALHKKYGATIPHTEWNSPGFIEKAMKLFAHAEALAGDNAELLDRIALAKLPVLYLKIEQGPGSDVDEYVDHIDEFERTAKKHNVNNIKSGLRGPFRDEIIQGWRRRAAASGV